MTDEGVAVLDDDLPAACNIRASDLSYVFAYTKLRCVTVSLAHKILLQFKLVSSSTKPKTMRSIK